MLKSTPEYVAAHRRDLADTFVIAVVFALVIASCGGGTEDTTPSTTPASPSPTAPSPTAPAPTAPSPTAPAPTASTTTTTAVQEVTTTTSARVVLSLAFDGENCAYGGPSELSAGEVDIVVHNESPTESNLYLWLLDEGRNVTAKAIADELAANPSAEPPSWIREAFGRHLLAGQSFEATRSLRPGTHFLTCALLSTGFTNFGGVFKVTE
jgi:hypothetical protein